MVVSESVHGRNVMAPSQSQERARELLLQSPQRGFGDWTSALRPNSNNPLACPQV
jgi:hypothetical protein